MNTHPLNAVSGTEFAVCLDIQQRQQHGITKYNTTVTDNPLALREWLQHAYEELLDGAIYLKRAMEKIDAETEQITAERQNIENVRKAVNSILAESGGAAMSHAFQLLVEQEIAKLPTVSDWPPLKTKG